MVCSTISIQEISKMQYMVWRGKKEEYELFSQEDGDAPAVPTLTHEQFRALEDFLKKKDNPALLPIQIAYYTGLRIGEVCALTWQDIDLDEQYLTVQRSIRYNGARHKTEIGATKRKKVRTVDFCDTLAAILRRVKKEQIGNRLRYGELCSLNYCTEVREKDRAYYEVYTLPRTAEVPEGYRDLSFVCLQPDGAIETPSTVSIMCRSGKEESAGAGGLPFPYAPSPICQAHDTNFFNISEIQRLQEQNHASSRQFQPDYPDRHTLSQSAHQPISRLIFQYPQPSAPTGFWRFFFAHPSAPVPTVLSQPCDAVEYGLSPGRKPIFALCNLFR